MKFIPHFLTSRKREVEETINRSLADMFDYFHDHNETYEDFLVYKKKGADWRSQERIKECREYCKRTKMPAYMHGIYEEQALDDLGQELLDYEKEVANHLNVHNNTGFPIDYEKDIDVSENAWTISQEWLKRYEDTLYRELSVEEQQSMEDVRKAFETLHTCIQKYGFDINAVIEDFTYTAPNFNITPDKVTQTYFVNVVASRMMAAMG